MSIINSIIQRKAGQPSVYREQPLQAGSTIGHATSDGGLRGHSLGDTWPFRVVLFGDGRAAVERNGYGTANKGQLSRHGAHEIAGLARRLYDQGDIDKANALTGSTH